MVYSKRKHPVRIILSGLTACGKSTQAQQLADRYEVPYVSMRPIMREISSEVIGSVEPALAWTPETDVRRAKHDRIDLLADHRMRAAIGAEPGVFDAWALPWLYRGDDAIRVWIEADMESRVERCRLSYEMKGEEPPSDPASLIEDKDEFTRRQLRKLHEIELGPDPDVFDLIIENSRLMTSPSGQVADEDSRRFNELLFRKIEAILGRDDRG